MGKLPGVCTLCKNSSVMKITDGKGNSEVLAGVLILVKNSRSPRLDVCLQMTYR